MFIVLMGLIRLIGFIGFTGFMRLMVFTGWVGSRVLWQSVNQVSIAAGGQDPGILHFTCV